MSQPGSTQAELHQNEAAGALPLSMASPCPAEPKSPSPAERPVAKAAPAAMPARAPAIAPALAPARSPAAALAVAPAAAQEVRSQGTGPTLLESSGRMKAGHLCHLTAAAKLEHCSKVHPCKVPRTVSQQRTEISKSFTTPRVLVLLAGGVLAICAGIVNVTVYSQLGGHFVSHMSGTVAHVGVRLEAVNAGEPLHEELRYACLILLSFLTGAMLCGMLVAKNEIYFGKSMYGAALACNSALLITAMLVPFKELAVYLAAGACGLQNGMCTMHFGAVVRTTHITGIVTDLGTSMGRGVAILLRKGCRRSRLGPLDVAELEVDLQRICVFALLMMSFGGGCVIGSYLQRAMQIYALAVPAGITGTGGLLYLFFRQQLKAPLRSMGMIRLSQDVQQVHDILEQAASVLDEVRRHAAEERLEHEAEDAALAPAAHSLGWRSHTSESNCHSDVQTPGARRFRRGESGAGSGLPSEAELEDSIGHMLAAIHDVEAGLERLVAPAIVV